MKNVIRVLMGSTLVICSGIVFLVAMNLQLLRIVLINIIFHFSIGSLVVFIGYFIINFRK